METQERILAKADIRKVSNKTTKIIKIVSFVILFVIVAALLFFGLSYGSHTDNNVGLGFRANHWTYAYWFDVPIVFYGHERHRARFFGGNIAWVSIMFLLLLGVPFYIDAIHKRQCKNTTLTISESKVYGSYSSFLFKKSLEMPIEKIDNLTTVSGLMDKLRSGSTLGICSASGVIKIHFVQNAEEVISAAMNRINEIKEKEKGSCVVAQTAANAPSSTTDKLKELLAMKESGLINEAEFTKKREEILSNM